jgi:acyl-coenzyme A thioesterase PaaI-like protein
MDTINYDPGDFFGFRNVPFHQHLGLAFERAEAGDGAAVVALPAAPELMDAGGLHAPAAAYTIAEVASALAACDALAALAPEIGPELKPVMLARRARFAPCGPLRGRIEAHARFVGDAAETIERLQTVRKATVPLEVRILSGDGSLGAEGSFDFYVRMMAESRLQAMTAAVETQIGGAR